MGTFSSFEATNCIGHVVGAGNIAEHPVTISLFIKNKLLKTAKSFFPPLSVIIIAGLNTIYEFS
jgi:hypothetical protein